MYLLNIVIGLQFELVYLAYIKKICCTVLWRNQNSASIFDAQKEHMSAIYVHVCNDVLPGVSTSQLANFVDYTLFALK